MSDNKIQKIKEEIILLLKGLSFGEIESLLYDLKKEAKDGSTF